MKCFMWLSFKKTELTKLGNHNTALGNLLYLLITLLYIYLFITFSRINQTNIFLNVYRPKTSSPEVCDQTEQCVRVRGTEREVLLPSDRGSDAHADLVPQQPGVEAKCEVHEALRSRRLLLHHQQSETGGQRRVPHPCWEPLRLQRRGCFPKCTT